MFIGVYLCSSGLIYLLVLSALVMRMQPKETVQNLRKQIFNYSLLALLLSGVGLALFLILSARAGILHVGQAGEYRLPQDYIEYGVFGWAILIWAVLGILSPIAAALISRRRLWAAWRIARR